MAFRFRISSFEEDLLPGGMNIAEIIRVPNHTFNERSTQNSIAI
jgi:hypothetical protein